jgi:hypothetical protein
MTQGSSTSITVSIIYVTIAVIAMLTRRVLEHWESKSYITVCEETKSEPRKLWSPIRTPLVPLILFLLVGTICLPAQPWRHMTSTLLFDVVGTIGTVLVTKTLRDLKQCPSSDTPTINGNSPYNPADDPYYISNLDSPIDEFIAEVIGDVKFTNVVHIVLESMRGDSYPFKENGHLAEYIQKTYPPFPGGAAVTTANISPFIDSLTEHMLQWDTTWTTVPFTHKAMMARMTYFPQTFG